MSFGNLDIDRMRSSDGHIAEIGSHFFIVSNTDYGAHVVVVGFNLEGDPICQRLDDHPLYWRGFNRHVLDIPAKFLAREMPTPPNLYEAALKLVKYLRSLPVNPAMQVQEASDLVKAVQARSEEEVTVGTNYYLTNSDGTPGRHIGKSSAGWCFGLQVYPDDDIRTLSDWIPDLMHGSIQDEYGEGVSFETMLKIICDRRWKGDVPQRHEIGNGCIGNGTGSWDLIAVDFS